MLTGKALRRIHRRQHRHHDAALADAEQAGKKADKGPQQQIRGKPLDTHFHSLEFVDAEQAPGDELPFIARDRRDRQPVAANEQAHVGKFRMAAQFGERLIGVFLTKRTSRSHQHCPVDFGSK